MSYFNNKKNVEQYIKITEGYDGSKLINILKLHLKEGSTLLELGMGPGKDLDILKDYFKVTGSDNSKAFLDYYKENNNNANVLLLDAVTLDTTNTYDCIYSNKVLQHLNIDEHKKSIESQYRILNKDGRIFHTFWYGEGEEEYDGLRFTYYKEEDIKRLYSNKFDIIEIKRYDEEEEGDSIYIVAKKKHSKNT